MRFIIFSFLALFSSQVLAGAGLVISSSPSISTIGEVTFVRMDSNQISVSTDEQTCVISRELLESVGLSPAELRDTLLQGEMKTTRLFCKILTGRQQAESISISFKSPLAK